MCGTQLTCARFGGGELLTAPHSPRSFACVNACLCVYVYILLISVSGICILSGLVWLGTFFTALDLKRIFPLQRCSYLNNIQQGSPGGAGKRWTEAMWRKEGNAETDAQVSVNLGDPRRDRSPKPWQRSAAWLLAHLTGLILDRGDERCHNREKGVQCGSCPRSLTVPHWGIGLSLSPAWYSFVSALHPDIEPGTSSFHHGPVPLRQRSFYKAKPHSQKKIRPSSPHHPNPLPVPTFSLSETEN